METTFKSPSTAELFDAPTPDKDEIISTPESEGAEEVDEKAVETETSDDTKKDSESTESEKDTTPDAKDTSTEDDEEEATTDYKLRYKEAEKWGQTKSQEAAKLKADLDALKKEYGVEDDKPSEEESILLLEQKIKTSEAIERANHGDEHIDKMLYAPDSPWNALKNDPLIDFRVRNSESPITEALKVVKEAEFAGKYGNDPEKIVKTIKAELEIQLRKEIQEEYKSKLKAKKDLGSDLSDVKSDKVSEEKKGFLAPTTKELYG